MAWGMQGRGRGGSRHVQQAWKNSEKIAALIEKLRDKNLSREDCYDLFMRENMIPYLGPSYFTKLIYFFSQWEDVYIMDQWTGKSVNLLKGCKVVKLYGSSPLRSNTVSNYKAFCSEINNMAQLLGVSGDEVEQMLFSWGGKSPQPWRRYVKKHT